MADRRIHYVLSTHWDREWYQPFQDYRYRLVQLIDRILDRRLQGAFCTDGQSILLEDYLEIRPERRAQVHELLRMRRILTGPWYVLPDEFLVSGESIVRNLRYGREIARRLGGEPSNAGFVCDMFGHISQLPQIFSGFGIKVGFIWRGTNTIETRHFIWRGADGTELPCYRFGGGGYCSFAFDVRHAHEPDRSFDPAKAAEDLKAYIESEARHTQVDPILLFDGGDHLEHDPRYYEVVLNHGAIEHTSLDEYMSDLLPQVEKITTRLEGELREPSRYTRDVDQQWLIPGVASSRVWIKQANAECQSLLCQWAEPFSAFAFDAAHPKGYLETAWRWLLQNHPHDSICGCSVDTVHEDMKYRFSQCRQIADRLATESMRKLALAVQGTLGDRELRVVVFNPLPVALEEPVELTLAIPASWPTFSEFFGFEPKPGFRIFDAEGKELAYQRLAQGLHRQKFQTFDVKFPQSSKAHDVKVGVRLSIPPVGYTTLVVRADSKFTRYPEVPGLATSDHSMENEVLNLRIEPNGTLTVADKRSGQTYEGWLTFEDRADIGDGWYHGVAVNDQVFSSTACRTDVALVHDGPMLSTFRLRTTMRVPAQFEFDRMVRSDRMVDLTIDSRVTLRAGCDRVEIHTIVYNEADDHRLRVLFPSGARAETFLADTPFDVVERPIALRKDNHFYKELEVETKPQQSWTSVHDGARGVAVVAAGLMEATVRDLPDRPVALTLFRGTRRTVFTDGEPLGQLRGPCESRYWIVPGQSDRIRLGRLGQQIVGGIRASQIDAKDKPAGLAPASASFLRVEGPAIMTSARRVEGGLEVRLFNPEASAANVGVGPARSAERVDFESRPQGDVTVSDGTARITLKPKQIVTLRINGM